MKKILLVCTTGLTMSILLAKMTKTIFANQLPIEVLAVSAERALVEYQEIEVDMVLLSPQVRYLKAKFEELTIPDKIPLVVIDMRDYGMIDGEGILLHAAKLLGQH